VRIGADVSKRMDYRPACLFIREIVRPTYVCRSCERQGQNIQAVQAPLPPEPIPRGTVAAGLLAHVLVSKYVDHLPLYRLEGILSRLGWDVSRSTLCDQMMACAGVLTPLYDLMVGRVKQSEALHTDDTSIPLLAPRRTAHAWVYVGAAQQPYIVFDLTAGRQQEFPVQFLAGYRGFIHADGYAGYNPLYAAGAVHVGCWAHTRRYFFEAKDNDPARAHQALARIRTLYAIEAQAKVHQLSGVNPWTYVRDLLTQLPARTPNADLTDLLPDVWIASHSDSAAKIVG
jgi:transposase